MASSALEEHHTEIYKLVQVTTPVRRDIWDSREAAIKWMKARVPWAAWDPRVFDIYVVRAFPWFDFQFGHCFMYT